MLLRARLNRCIILSGLLVFILAGITFFINAFIFKYPGNNYFPYPAFIAGINLLILYLVTRGCFSPSNYYVQLLQNLLALYVVYAAIAICVNGVQYTPFNPIDTYLINLERHFYINIDRIVAWTISYPTLVSILAFIYDSLSLQLAILPFLLCLLGHFDTVRTFCCYMLITAFWGLIFYYFFPTIAPASAIKGPFFSDAQFATGIKFYQIHHYIPPTTADGGMIALPSFHVVWALLCLYLVQCWHVIFIFLLAWNIVLIISCVLLGWHYPIDVLGGFVIIYIGYLSLRIFDLIFDSTP